MVIAVLIRLILRNAAIVAVALLPTFVAAQTVNPDDMKLELTFEELKADPFVGEMVLLTVHGEYKIPISREVLQPPDLDGFDWMQLGEDTWTEDTTKGRKIVDFKRVIALFPNRAGPIEVEPFVHKLELLTSSGKRYDYDVVAKPIELTAQAQPETGKWWMPSRRLTITDDWSNPPHLLGEGEGALRVVTLTVEGVRPEQIPQMPELGSAGAFVFAHPEHRTTRLYRRGPVTRAVWRWTVRPEHPPSAYLKPISVPYFDTKTREHKEIVIAAQRIAMTEEAVAAFLAEADEESVAAMQDARGEGPLVIRHAAFAAPVAMGLGVLGGLAWLLPGVRIGGRRKLKPLLAKLRPDPDVKTLKRAATASDVAAARAAGVRLMARRESEEMREALARLDARVFAPIAGAPDLKSFAREMVAAWRRAARG